MTRLHGGAALDALVQRVVGESLYQLETVTVLAEVLVRRHRRHGTSHAGDWHSRADSASARHPSARQRILSFRVRIAIVTDYYYPQLGGITEHVHGQATQLAAPRPRGHRHHRAAAAPAGRGRRRRAPPARRAVRGPPHRRRRCPCTATPPRRCTRLPPLLWESLRSLFRRAELRRDARARAVQPELRHARAPRDAEGERSASATYHSVFSPGPLPRYPWPADALVLSASSTPTIVVSEACVGSLAPYFPFDYRVIPNGIDEPPLHARGRAARGAARRRQARDPVPRPLRSAQRPRHDARRVRAASIASTRATCGCASSATGRCARYYQRQVARTSSRDVVWAGRVDWARPRYYASADVHCTPCNRASFGMVLLEAMSCGRPVVASRISGLPARDGARQARPAGPARRTTPTASRRPPVPARPSGRARAHGARGPAHGGRAQYAWTEGRRAARGTTIEDCCAGGARRTGDEAPGPRPASAARARRAPALAACSADRRRHGHRGRWAWLARVRVRGGARLLAWAASRPNAPLFGRVIDGHGVPTASLAITFDDGPSPDDHAARARRAARRATSRATFFVLGRHAEQHPEIVAADPRARARGRIARPRPRAAHVRQRRATSRDSSTAPRPDRRRAPASEPTPPLPRPARLPQPVRASRRAAGRGYRVVGWTKGVWDTALPGADRSSSRSVARLPPRRDPAAARRDGTGHGDDRTQTAEALPQILDAAHDAGYQSRDRSRSSPTVAPVRRSRAGADRRSPAIVVGVTSSSGCASST